MPYYEGDEDDLEPTGTPEVSDKDEKLLKHIRERYRYFCDYWKEVREERAVDMRYICGDPWPPEDRKARTEADRPVLNHDELGQYVNQSLNNIRQNKRGIKVEPAGEGTDDKTAEYRQARIRAIEYRSKAQAAYETAFQQMLEGSYGYFRIGRKWVSSDKGNWRQDIVIRSIPNPDSVLYSPDTKEPDWSDAEEVFVIEPLAKAQFKRQYKNARRTDFTRDDQHVAPGWITDETVMVAEYWRVEVDTEKQIRTNPATGKKETRTVECKHVWQYITNGVEILEKNEQPGAEIPIIPCIGLERYLPDSEVAGASKRKIFSLVRLARDPQMMLAYLVSQEAEEAGLTPKTPYLGYVGQFETDREAWSLVTKKPYPYLQADPIPDSANGQILPLPARQPFTPNFQAYEIAKDSARRAIQAAMGISPLPTAAQRDTEKSGVALQRIQGMQALGSFHFVDNFERALERAGRIIESWIPLYDSEEMSVPICAADGKRSIVRINTPEPVVNPQTGQAEQYVVEEGEHDVTVSTGPSNQSQRDAASDFLNALVQNLPNLPIAPPQAAALLAKSIEMMQLGPLGDQMAEIINPQQNGQQIPPQAQAAMAQAQAQLQQLGLANQQLQAQVQQLTFEKQAKVVENTARIQLEREQSAARIELEREKIEGQITVAEINTKMQDLNERTAWIADMVKELHGQRHEMALQEHRQTHEREMAAMDHVAAMAQQDAAAAASAASAANGNQNAG